MNAIYPMSIYFCLTLQEKTELIPHSSKLNYFLVHTVASPFSNFGRFISSTIRMSLLLLCLLLMLDRNRFEGGKNYVSKIERTRMNCDERYVCSCYHNTLQSTSSHSSHVFALFTGHPNNENTTYSSHDSRETEKLAVKWLCFSVQ